MKENKIDLSTFIPAGNSRLEAYGHHMDFEMSFYEPKLRDLITFKDFCKELDLGYGNSDHVQIARLYEDETGKIWYDNEYVQ